METIKTYIENMFAGMPRTEEVLKMKKQLLADMEEKYLALKEQGKTENEAIGVVISEFGNIDELAEAMGVNMQADEETPVVTLEAAEQYLRKNKGTAFLTAIGVSLCILSPAVLIFCGVTFSSFSFSGIAAGLGLMIMFTMIAIAVGLFVYCDHRMKDYEYIKETFYISAQTKAELQSGKKSVENTASLATIIGIALCIMAPVPLILLAIISDGKDMLAALGVINLLAMVALGVFFLVYFNEIKEGYEKILQEGEFTEKSKKTNKIKDIFESFYWLIILAVFFVWGAVYDGWGISWIVFPIGGVLYGLIEAITKLFFSDKSK